MPAVIFSGTEVKALKSQLNLNDSAKVLTGTDDPTSVAKDAPIGSIYLRQGTAGVYRKDDAGSSTNWTELITAAGAGSPPVGFKINGPVEELFDTFDGWHRVTASRTYTNLTISANASGSGTTTAQIERWSGGPSGTATASTSLTGTTGVDETKGSISLAVVDGDMIRAKLTAIAAGLEDVRVEVI